MKKVLVAGATGHLGRAVTRELHRRGYWTRALARDPARLEETRALADDVVVGEPADPSTFGRACAGVEVVFSCLGSPINLARQKQRASHREVDYALNKRLLDAARQAGVAKFVYVSMFGAAKLPHLEYVKSHEDFVDELKRSGIEYAVIRPTGFFYSLAELVKLARNPAMVMIGSGAHRTNPIHEEDLAGVCVEAVAGEQREYEAGGPETYTRKEIQELAFAALGKRPRMISVPPALIKAGLRALRPFDRRRYELLLFLVSVTQVDCVAPATGVHSFERYYGEIAKEVQRQNGSKQRA